MPKSSGWAIARLTPPPLVRHDCDLREAQVYMYYREAADLKLLIKMLFCLKQCFKSNADHVLESGKVVKKPDDYFENFRSFETSNQLENLSLRVRSFIRALDWTSGLIG